MKQSKFSFLSYRTFAPPPAAMLTTLSVYLLVSLALAYIMPVAPLLGVAGAVAINLVVLFFLRSRLALPLYILVAGPSLALTLSRSGTLSRLYLGNLLFALVVGVWILQTVLPMRKSGKRLLELSLFAPITGLILVGISSIIYSRLSPDPRVIYTYPHSTVSINIVNLAELAVMIGLPMFLIIVPSVVRRISDARLATGAFVLVGSLFSLATICAGPLGLIGRASLLGNRRPTIFSLNSSTLGTLLVLFTTIAFGQALYATKLRIGMFWGLITLIFSVAVILAFGREAWIALFLAVMVMIGFRTQNWSAVLVLLVVPPLVATLITVLVPSVIDFFNSSKVYGSDRLIIWQDAISIWQRSPIFGVGAGNFQFFDRTYSIDKVGVAHNQYLEILAEMGVQGLLCFIWLLTAVGIRSLRGFATAKTRLGKSIALSQVAFFVTIVFGGFFEDFFLPSAAAGGGTGPFIEASYRWILLGLVLSIPNWEKVAGEFEHKTHQPDSRVIQQVEAETLLVPDIA